MMTFQDYCLLAWFGLMQMIPFTILFATNGKNKTGLIITFVPFFIGVIMFLTFGTRALETFPSIYEIKELLR